MVEDLRRWLSDNGCYLPLHHAWEEHSGRVDLPQEQWARLKDGGMLGDADCKWAIARVFRVYAMWRLSVPGAPLLVLSREGADRVRVWINPERDRRFEVRWWLGSFEAAARYREWGEE